MIKPKFELFMKNKDVIGVISKNPKLASRLNKVYKRYEGFKPCYGEEALFWVPLASKDTLKALIRLREWPMFDLAEGL